MIIACSLHIWAWICLPCLAIENDVGFLVCCEAVPLPTGARRVNGPSGLGPVMLPHDFFTKDGLLNNHGTLLICQSPS